MKPNITNKIERTSEVIMPYLSISLSRFIVVGMFRLSSAPDARAMGRVSSQHLWIVFSLSTAVLSLLFGSYFYPGSSTLSYASIAIMSLISVITLFAVVSAATQRVPIFD